MSQDFSEVTKRLNAKPQSEWTGADWDADRDAWQAADDAQRDEREIRMAMAVAAGRHPYQHLMDAPGVPGGKNAHVLPPARPDDAAPEAPQNGQ